MRWYAISGPWSGFNSAFADEVHSLTERILMNGAGLVTGDYFGADYLAASSFLQGGSSPDRLKVFLSVSLEDLFIHYHNMASLTLMSSLDIREVISFFEGIASSFPEILQDSSGFIKRDSPSFDLMNSRIVKKSDEIYAFQFNNNLLVQDLVDKARYSRKPVHLVRYYN